MNQGVHAVDLLQWLVGLPARSVRLPRHARAHHGGRGHAHRHAALSEHGALGVIEAATSAWPGDDLQIEIAGDKGSATIVNDKVTRWEFAETAAG